MSALNISVKRAELIQRLTASFLDSKVQFKEPDYPRLIDTAVVEYSYRRPRERVLTMTLTAGCSLYECPDDLVRVLGHDWGRSIKVHGNPWDDGWPGQLPGMRVVEWGDERALRLSPAPTARQIGLLGPFCTYRYAALHLLQDQGATFDEDGAGLVILRAQAEAMRELAMRNVDRPYQLRDGISAQPKNGTAGYLYQALLAEFNERTC